MASVPILARLFRTPKSMPLVHRVAQSNDTERTEKNSANTSWPPASSVSGLCVLCETCLGWFECDFFGLAEDMGEKENDYENENEFALEVVRAPRDSGSPSAVG